MTTVGRVEVERRYYACRHCTATHLPFDDWAGMEKLEQEAAAQRHKGKRKALNGLLGYPRPNQEALRYGDRLRRGLAIGSGQIEGACKTVVGRRLKLNSARWSPPNIEPIASLCGLQYSDLWEPYWSTRAA